MEALCCYFCFANLLAIISAMAFAACSTHTPKLGQSLKSITTKVPSGRTMQSPP